MLSERKINLPKKSTTSIFSKLYNVSHSLFDMPLFNKTQAKILTFLMLPTISMAEEILTYFRDHTTTTYQLKSLNLTEFNEVLAQIQAGIFGLSTNVSYIPISFDPIRSWAFSGTVLAQLARGAGETFNATLETLLINLFELANEKYVKAQREEEKFAGILVGSLFGAILLGVGGTVLIRKVIKHCQRTATNMNNQTEQATEPSIAIVVEKAPQNITAESSMGPVKKEEKKKTIVERLKACGITEYYDEPLCYFLCPITQEPMTDPVVANDGITYERSAIQESMKHSSRSPMNNKVRLTHLVENVNLRKQILEYTEARELEYQKAIAQKPNSPRPSQRNFFREAEVVSNNNNNNDNPTPPTERTPILKKK